MGVLPLQFSEGVDRKALKLDGTETFTIEGVANLKPRQTLTVKLTRADGSTETFETLCRIDTVNELEYFYRSEEHTSELQSLMRISYAVFCLKKKNTEHTSYYKSNCYLDIAKSIHGNSNNTHTHHIVH